MRSRDRGTTWEEASPDLTKAIDRDTMEIMGRVVTDETLSDNDGISSYGNITAFAESKHSPDALYVGTDDGNLQVSLDGGASWTNVIDEVTGVPPRTYVSRLETSSAADGRVYVTFDGHRNDDYAPYAYVSEDHGASWRRITAGLPDGWSVNVIREHPGNPNLLFVGNEIGVYLSIDRGESWARMVNNLPTVAGGRHRDPPARERPRRGHARAQHLDPGRHHAAGGDVGRRVRLGLPAVRRPARHDVVDGDGLALPARDLHRTQPRGGDQPSATTWARGSTRTGPASRSSTAPMSCGRWTLPGRRG